MLCHSIYHHDMDIVVFTFLPISLVVSLQHTFEIVFAYLIPQLELAVKYTKEEYDIDEASYSILYRTSTLSQILIQFCEFLQKIESKNIFISLQTSTPRQGRKLLIITTHFSEGMDGDEDSSRLPTRGVVSIIYAVVLLAL